MARSSGSPPSMASMLRTLREVAAGMAFLHDKSIIHRDLTGGCVPLEQPQLLASRWHLVRAVHACYV